MKTGAITHKQLRKNRVRARIHGTAVRPRLSVFRGSKTLFLQLIDDDRGVTLASASEKELSKNYTKKTKTERAKGLGLLIAEKAKQSKISSIIFDRGSSAYHGRVQAIAEGAREGGLQF
ncbi:50S ribosomal protein L18 [Candidatus Uhrbacteria bacterium]|nr:50S ribosomal protein L18 [Candidatus Uhrbacteria bacterium]